MYSGKKCLRFVKNCPRKNFYHWEMSPRMSLVKTNKNLTQPSFWVDEEGRRNEFFVKIHLSSTNSKQVPEAKWTVTITVIEWWIWKSGIGNFSSLPLSLPLNQYYFSDSLLAKTYERRHEFIGFQRNKFRII